MNRTAGLAAILVSATAGGCADARPDQASCYSRPGDFMKAEDWSKDLIGEPDMAPMNVIKVQKSGSVTWNDADLSSQHGWTRVLDMYLEIIPEMNPQPMVFLEWEDGAPCASIQQARKLMRKHLKCDGSRTCLQGHPA